MTTPTQVLIVDDRVSVRTTLRHTLRGFDCEICEAGKGAVALDLISKTYFDIVFLDLMLPDLPGIEILRQARESHARLGKVIILTGQPEPATQEEAKKLYAFRYLTKSPISREEIRRAFVEAISDSGPFDSDHE